jgi:hypothetical protein
MIDHAFRTKVNEHHASNLPDDQQPRRTLTASKASVGEVPLVKLITLFIVIFHGYSYE